MNKSSKKIIDVELRNAIIEQRLKYYSNKRVKLEIIIARGLIFNRE